MKESEAVKTVTTFLSMAVMSLMERQPIDITIDEETKEELKEEFGEGDPFFLLLGVMSEALIEALVSEGLIFEPEDE